MRFVVLMQMVRDMMEEGKKYGFNVIRIWAHSVSVELRLQTAPGKYNEAVSLVHSSCIQW